RHDHGLFVREGDIVARVDGGKDGLEPRGAHDGAQDDVGGAAGQFHHAGGAFQEFDGGGRLPALCRFVATNGDGLGGELTNLLVEGGGAAVDGKPHHVKAIAVKTKHIEGAGSD